MRHLCVMFLLLCCTKVTKTAIPIVVAPLKPVIGIVGDDLILPCYLKNSVSAVDMEVQWIINGNQLVHQYRRHMDVTDQQLPAYSGRTSLFREELQRGNISLKLRPVRLSDTNTYRCYVSADDGTADDSFKVQIHALGNKPEISAESHNNGSVTLLCKSTNWTIEPIMEWMDSEGIILQNAGDSLYCYGDIQRSVTVKEQHGYNYTCRVSYLNRTKETWLDVPRALFSQSRHRWNPLAIFVLVLLSCVILPLSMLYKKHNVLQKYKESLISAFKERSRYSEVLIIHGHRKMHIGKKIPISSKKDYKQTSVEQLFKGQDHSLVILQGEPGYGKSFTAQKTMHDWAQGSFCADLFDLVVLLKCDELALSSQTQSLLEIISDDQKYTSLMNEILTVSPHKVLFLIDGLDEFTFSEQDIEPSPTNLFTPASSKAILCGLLRGHILPQSSLLVTTRPFASDRPNRLLKGRTWRFAEIRGFTEQGVEEYFKKFFDGEHTRVYQDVKKNEMLFTSCYNPFMCWITCTVKQQLKVSEQNKLDGVGTTTSIFCIFINILLQQQPADKKLDLLTKLHELAKKVIENGTAEFDFPDLPKDLDCVFRNIDTDQNRMSRFRHQSLVEFFFALGYAIPGKEKAEREVEELLISAQSDFPNSLFDLQPVLKFLFGLSNETVRDSLCRTCGLESPTSPHENSLCLQTQLKQWILARIDIFFRHKSSVLVPFHCLYEFHNKQFVEEVMQLLRKMRFPYIPLTHTDCWVIRYCLEQYPSIRTLDLRHCSLTSEKLKLLQPALTTLEYGELCTLQVTADGLEDTDIVELVSSLEKGILLSPSDQNVRTSGSEDPKQKSVNLQLMSVKSFKTDTASSLLKTFQGTKHLLNMSLEMDERAGADSFCLSFSAERDDTFFTLTVGFHKAEHKSLQPPEVLLISLVLPAEVSPEQKPYDWAKLVQDVQSIRRGNSLQHLIHDLKKLEIGMNYLPHEWASNILCYIHQDENTRSNLMDINVWADDETNNGGAGAFSFLKLKRVTDETFRLEMKLSEDEKNPEVSRPCKPSQGDHVVQKRRKRLKIRLSRKKKNPEVSRPPKPSDQLDALSEITETVSIGVKTVLHDVLSGLIRNLSSDESTVSLIIPTSEVSNYDKSSDLLTNILRLGAPPEKYNEELNESAQGLLSISNMEHMKLRVKCISESLATLILSSCNKHQKMHISIETPSNRQVDNLCSRLTVEKDEREFKLSVMDGRVSSSPYTAPALSGINLHLDPLLPLDIDWKCFFGTFYTLRNIKKSSPDVDGCVGDFLSSLSCLRGLKTVDLFMSYSSDSLINNIKSRMEDCSIQETRVSCGENVDFMGNIVWHGQGEQVQGEFGYTCIIKRGDLQPPPHSSHSGSNQPVEMEDLGKSGAM